MTASSEQLQVAPEDTGKRLDSYLHERLPQFSRSRLQAWIKGGRVQVDDSGAKASQVLRGGERIVVRPVNLPPLNATAENIPLHIVYEDADVIVVDKAAGMVVHAGAGHPAGTLTNALVHHFGQLSKIGGELRPGIVHRLDRDTSGLLVIARSDAAHRSLARQFQDRTVEKIYLALVHGRMKSKEGSITAPITRDPARRIRMTCKLGTGRSAFTSYKVLREFERFSLLEVKIGTGRTHQIRVHLASLHHPIVGDRLYGAPASVAGLPKLERFFLHAHRMGFESPSTGGRLGFESPVPKDFSHLLQILTPKGG